MSRQKSMRPCNKCGVLLGTRERRSHRCPLSVKARPKVLRPCDKCGAMLGAREARVHRCPEPPKPYLPPSEITREEMIRRITEWQAEHGHKRRYGTGSIFQAKDGRWHAFITIGRDESDERIRKKLTGHTREEVISKLETIGIAPVVSEPRPLGNRSDAQLKRMYERTH